MKPGARGVIVFVVGLWGLMCLVPAAFGLEAKMSELLITYSPEPPQYILVYSTLELPFEGKIQQAIQSGISTTFLFELRLYLERPFRVDDQIFSKKVIHTVKYDMLRKQYDVYIKDGKKERFLATHDYNEMKKWMTQLEGIRMVPLSEIEVGQKYYILAKAQMKALNLPFYLEYMRFLIDFEEFETPWVRSLPISIHRRR